MYTYQLPTWRSKTQCQLVKYEYDSRIISSRVNIIIRRGHEILSELVSVTVIFVVIVWVCKIINYTEQQHERRITIYACSCDIDTSLCGGLVGNNCREKLAENLSDTCTSSTPASKTRENYKLQTISRKIIYVVCANCRSV